MKRLYQGLFSTCVLIVIGLLAGCQGSLSKPVFSFDIATDMREFADAEHSGPEYFKGACLAILQAGKGDFMVSPGDIDPPGPVYSMINDVLGPDYPWYPVVGNHESETTEDMEWLRKYGTEKLLDHVSPGPKGCEETTYSFDHKNTHIIVINQYYDGQSDTGTNGDVPDALYEWVKKDIEGTTKPFIFVFGHEPLISIPDIDNGRHRHQGDSLDEHPENSHRFAKLLRQHHITAYVNGHTHTFSHAKINGLWQIDVGHARGMGDKRARSTFLKVYLGTDKCWIDAYRLDYDKNAYLKTDTIILD